MGIGTGRLKTGRKVLRGNDWVRNRWNLEWDARRNPGRVIATRWGKLGSRDGRVDKTDGRNPGDGDVVSRDPWGETGGG